MFNSEQDCSVSVLGQQTYLIDVFSRFWPLFDSATFGLTQFSLNKRGKIVEATFWNALFGWKWVGIRHARSFCLLNSKQQVVFFIDMELSIATGLHELLQTYKPLSAFIHCKNFNRECHTAITWLHKSLWMIVYNTTNFGILDKAQYESTWSKSTNDINIFRQRIQT